ncbi:MAG TPA: cyclic nucleotide-binding domain-containing protein [Rhizomicrobium sp.]
MAAPMRKSSEKPARQKPAFDPKAFLSRVNGGRTIGEYRKDHVVFRQGDPADAVFYIQTGKAKVIVVSEQGKEAVVASEKAVLPGSRGVSRPSWRSPNVQ